MKITRLDSARWQDYKALRLEAVKDSPESFLSTVEETLTESDTEWQDKIKNMIFAVNEDDKLVGMVGCVRGQKEKLNHIIDIVSVYVTPKYRKQGIGKQLLQSAIDFAKSTEGVSKVQLGVITTQTAARNLYDSMGFEAVGTLRRAIKVDGKYFDDCQMEILLD